MVERRPDPDDARAVQVHLTERGRARLDEMRAAREVLLEARLMRLTDEEREVLANALPVLDKLMEEGPEE
jgi:DNA-binding MarR family transcriptional regulator